MVDTRDARDAEGRDGGGPHVDWGIPVELPVSVLDQAARRMPTCTPWWCATERSSTRRADSNLGRTTRLANVAQRRALRAIYPRCAIPDCPTRFDHCKIHHIRWWRHGGRTDLDNLLPVCFRHHDLIHHAGWVVELGPDRVLTLTLPNGEVMTTGPPRRRAA